jgi:ABC-type multidrug transport system fused ATPase/permease subunit
VAEAHPRPVPLAPARASHRRMWRLTFGHVKETLRAKPRMVAVTIALSVIAGFAPTAKSTIESSLFSTIVDATQGRDADVGGPSPTDRNGPDRAWALLKRPVHTSTEDDFVGRASGVLIAGQPFLAVLLGYLMLAVMTALLKVGATNLRAMVEKGLFIRLRNEGVLRGLSSDPALLPPGSTNTAQYSSAVQAGASQVSATYAHLLESGDQSITLVTTFLVVWTKSRALALLLLVVCAAHMAISRLKAKRTAATRQRYDQIRNRLVAQGDDYLTKREIIVANEKHQHYAWEVGKLAEQYADNERELAVAESKFSGAKSILDDVGRMGLFLGAGVFLLLTATTSSSADLYFFASIYARLLYPADRLLSFYDSFRRSESQAKTYLDLLEYGRPPAPVAAQDAEKEPAPEVVFDRVGFRYPDAEQDVLNECSFIAPAGRVTLIVGPSGCGKSTIARLLLGFWRPARGAIRIGGCDAVELEPPTLRSRIAYAAQADHIVDDSIRGNLIGWGDQGLGPTDLELLELLRSVGMTNTDNEEYLQGEARNLSLGQQQRIALARLMLDQSPLLLLDEPLAGVDVFTVKDLLPLFRARLKKAGCSVIIITHRLAFANLADHVVILAADGRVEEEGSPEELEKKRGVYFELRHTALAEISGTRMKA